MTTRLSSRILCKCLRSSLTGPTCSSLRGRAPSSTLQLSGARFASYYPHLEPKQKKGVKIGHVFSALALLGIGATAFGLYDFYQSFTTFPSPIRNHLRTALRAINDGPPAHPRADASFSAAYDLALEMANKGELGNQEEALMKSTGVAIRWGGMWEEAGELGRATEVYSKAFEQLTPVVDSGKASKKEIMRAVAVAMKLGDLAILTEAATRDPATLRSAERMYTFAVEEMMRLKMTPGQLAKVKEEMDNGPKSKAEKQDELETDLPSWAGDVQLTAGMERLGELYAKLGNVELATPLLQQTIALLLPPPPKDGSEHVRPPIPTRCHAATLMNNLSSVLVSAPSPTAKSIEDAVRWSGQALTVAGRAKKEAEAARKGKMVPLGEREEAECDLVAVVGSYNLGKLSELSKDKVAAKAWFEQSLVQSRRIGRDGSEAIEALRRL